MIVNQLALFNTPTRMKMQQTLKYRPTSRQTGNRQFGILEIVSCIFRQLANRQNGLGKLGIGNLIN